jgi:cytochrome b subunit of formate dehydrogenase
MPESFFRTVNEWIAAWAVFILVILNYVIFGPKRVEHDVQDLAVVRFSTGERIIIIIWARAGNLRLIAHPIHNIAAFIGIIAVIVHAYLGSLANPGTLRGIFEGEN